MPDPLSIPRTTDRSRALASVALAYALALVAGIGAAWAFRGAGPIVRAAIADLAATVVVFGFSVGHDNSSIYDPYWSLAPIPIVAFWAGSAAEPPDVRALLVLLLVTVWGLRLTANWVLRWRGLRDEDFRYREIRERTGRAYWPASLVGIHLLPTIWVFLGLLPLWPALGGGGRPPGVLDLLALVVTAGGIAVESVADAQLRRFLRSRGDPAAVLDAGLWRRSRHPNYFGEVTFWWGLWLFGLAADPGWAWTAVGPLCITLLFVGVSIPWMDRRMISRHPDWAARMRATPALVPWRSARAPARHLLVLLAAAGALHARRAAAADGAPAVEELRLRYAGEYLFVGGDTERAGIPAAVERSVDGMFFIARGIAYDRLLRTCQICSRYTIGFGGGNITVAGPCQLSDVSPDDGREADHTTRLGDRSKLSQRFVDQTLVQDFRADEGSRKVIWTLLPDGDTLRVRVLITSKHLPHPVDYTLTYRRRSIPPAPVPDAGPG